MQTNFMPPPGLRGAPEAQLVQMHSFLFRLTEQLNAALEATDKRIETAQATANSAQNRPGSNIIINNGGSGEGGGDTTTPDFTEQYNELKALIDKTAKDVQAEMDILETELKSSYIAKSEWGTYEENLKADFTSTAEGVVLVRAAQREGLPVTAEATPHHLVFACDELEADDANYKMAPPLGNREDRAELRRAVKDGALMFGNEKLDLSRKLENVAEYEGKAIVFGFRPEAIKLGETDNAYVIPSEVELTEMLGDNTNVYITVEDAQAILKVDSHDTPEMGQQLTFSIPYESVYLFDGETENVIK